MAYVSYAYIGKADCCGNEHAQDGKVKGIAGEEIWKGSKKVEKGTTTKDIGQT